MATLLLISIMVSSDSKFYSVFNQCSEARNSNIESMNQATNIIGLKMAARSIKGANTKLAEKINELLADYANIELQNSTYTDASAACLLMAEHLKLLSSMEGQAATPSIDNMQDKLYPHLNSIIAVNRRNSTLGSPPRNDTPNDQRELDAASELAPCSPQSSN